MNNKLGLQCLLLMVLLWLGGCHASRQSGVIYEENLPNTVLWKIDSKDLTEPSYLLGTIHLIPADLFFWPEEFQQAYEASTQVVMETNELSMDPAAMMSIMPKIMLPDGQSIEDFVTEAEYARIDQFFSQMGLPVMLFKNMKPFFLYMLVDIDMGSLMRDDIKSYEMEITEIANEDKKPILGLETLDFQVSLFDSIPYQDQADLLVQSIEDKLTAPEGEANRSSELLFQTYVNQDLNAILSEIKKSDVGFANFSRLLLDNRNRDWIPKIEEIIRESPSFIAVGAAHLPGETGVIHLLKKEGYTLTPILNLTNGSH